MQTPMQMPSEAVLYKMLLDTAWEPPFPTIADRNAWAAVSGRPLARRIRERAAEVAGRPVPPLPLTLFLDLDRTGRRDPYQDPMFERRARLAFLALAECMEDQGRYLDDIIDLIWAICEESTWCLPAHMKHNNQVFADANDFWLDLVVAMTGHELAEMDHILGDRLPPAVRKRIRVETRRRITDVYLRRSDFVWLGLQGKANNWNAVCHCGVVAVALYLETDLMVQARVLAKALAHLPAYLRSFDEDGCTSEGAGYWNYGFSHYAMLAHLAEHRTGGKVNLLDGGQIRNICRFPIQLELSPGKFVNFSDAHEHTVLSAGVVSYLGLRCDLPALVAAARCHLPHCMDHPHVRPILLLRDLFETDDQPARPEGIEPTAFYSGFQWLISRANPSDADGLVLAAKGGHNAEDHNQNDVGQFIIHYGRESIVMDLGPQRYTREFFGPKRYEILECRSAGHGVPVVNGYEQGLGAAYAASLVATEFAPAGDSMEIEMAGAYPAEAGIESLRRTFSLSRSAGAGSVTVVDRFRFAGGSPGEFESRIHTLARVEQMQPGHVRLVGKNATLGLRYEGELAVEEIQPDVNSLWGPVLHRLRFTVRAAEGSLALHFTPEA